MRLFYIYKKVVQVLCISVQPFLCVWCVGISFIFYIQVRLNALRKRGIYMTGPEVRQMILDSGVMMWQVAEAMGIYDSTLSKKFRKDFNDEEVKEIKAAIDKIISEKAKKDLEAIYLNEE